MDQYFHQMRKIVDEKKMSSRIRFMLQDVVDLRQVSNENHCYIWDNLTAILKDFTLGYFCDSICDQNNFDFQGKWVPRRDDNNPKTLDQIHKDAKREEDERNQAIQQAAFAQAAGGGGGSRDKRDKGKLS